MPRPRERTASAALTDAVGPVAVPADGWTWPAHATNPAVGRERTKTAAVTRALREHIARHEQRRIVELFAALDWDPGYDYKAERTR